MFNAVLHALIIFRIFIIETKLDFVSFNDTNLQRPRKFVAQRDFPILNSYTGQVLRYLGILFIHITRMSTRLVLFLSL